MAVTPYNLLLETLPLDALETLDPQEQQHPIETVLIRPDETPAFIFFPHRGSVVSIVRSTEDGSTVEAGVIGSEGMFHIQTLLTTPAPTGSQALVQIEGNFSRVEASRVLRLFRDNAPFRDLSLAFTSSFLEQVTQNLVCNRLHAIEHRLAKWLLIIRDRTETDDLHLTHEFLSHMLGIHRPGVSIAVATLEAGGLIQHGRNSIVISSRERLMAHSCECYAILHRSLRTFTSSIAA